MIRPLLVVLVVALLTPCRLAGDARAAAPLRLGFFDGVFTAPAAERDPWLQRSVDAGADIVRIEIGWPVTGGAKRPQGLDARDPADPHYDFTQADAAVQAARAQGLAVLASFTGAPRWAEGPGRPSSAPPTTWKPDPTALGDYGTALARRYSGLYPDPADPAKTLPRVEAFQLWNEPNLAKYLSPQWSNRRTVAPAHYRSMLRAFSAGVKSVDPRALVVTAGTAPFGDAGTGGRRIAPVRFWREMLCLTDARGRLRRAACPGGGARFDVLAHHPYAVDRPRRAALNAEDVSVADLHKLRSVLRAAERLGTALPRGRKHRFWVTEFSYDSSPPDPQGVPSPRHARWTEEALYLMWRQGIDTVTWFQVRDEAPNPSYEATNQSGMYLRDGRAKTARRAFRFPLVAERADRGVLRVWARSPQAGALRIERRQGSRWMVVKRLRVSRHGTVLTRLRGGSGTRLRARIGAETSFTWVVS